MKRSSNIQGEIQKFKKIKSKQKNIQDMWDRNRKLMFMYFIDRGKREKRMAEFFQGTMAPDFQNKDQKTHN